MLAQRNLYEPKNVYEVSHNNYLRRFGYLVIMYNIYRMFWRWVTHELSPKHVDQCAQCWSIAIVSDCQCCSLPTHTLYTVCTVHSKKYNNTWDILN